MFCEKCGATMPDDSMFCEKCGARVQPENTAGSNTAGNAFAGMGAGTGGQAFSNPYNDSSLQWAQTPPAGNFAAPKPSAGNQFSKIFQMFFKAPTAAMKACAQDDYSVPGLVFLGGKCVIVALLLAIFRETISYYVPGLQWTYMLTGPMTFLVTLFVLLIMDAIWVGLMIAVSQTITSHFDVKRIVGVAGTGSLYVSAFVIVGLLLGAVFQLSGVYIALFTGIVTTGLLQYEGMSGIVGAEKKDKGVYAMMLAVLVFVILWLLIGEGAEAIFAGSYGYDYY